MRPTHLLDWKIARAKPLSGPELAHAFRLWDARVTYWVANKILAERAQNHVEQARAQQCLDALIPGLDYLFAERDRLTAQGKFNPAALAPVGYPAHPQK